MKKDIESLWFAAMCGVVLCAMGSLFFMVDQAAIRPILFLTSCGFACAAVALKLWRSASEPENL